MRSRLTFSLLPLLAFAACTASDDSNDPAISFDAKADGYSPPRKAWLPLEKPETIDVAFTDDSGASAGAVYAEFALSGGANVTFTSAADASLSIYAQVDGAWQRVAKQRDSIAAELDAGNYRLLLRKLGSTTTTSLTTGCAGDGCTVYPAFPYDPPQLVSKGGPVLATPRLIAATFDGDEIRSGLEDFISQIGGSDYWYETTAEYGIAPATSDVPVRIADAPPASLTLPEMRAWLAGKLDGTHPEWGTPDASAFYVVFFPKSTVLDLNGLKGCTGFGGYHDATQLADGTTIVFAAIARCDVFNAGLVGIDQTTAITSHELIEAVTDPQPSTNPAYNEPDDDHGAWEIVTGGEAGDLCAAVPGAYAHVTDFPYMIQRTWSNASALAKADPCVPHVAADPYVVAVPQLDRVTIGSSSTFGAHVPVGTSRTIEVDVASAGPTAGPLTLQAVDAAQLKGAAPTVALAWDTTTGTNGDRAHLTITTISASPQGFATIIIGAKTSDDNASLWHALVTY